MGAAVGNVVEINPCSARIKTQHNPYTQPPSNEDKINTNGIPTIPMTKYLNMADTANGQKENIQRFTAQKLAVKL